MTNDLIIKTDTSESLIESASLFFEAKKKLENELEKMNRIEKFYSKELRDIKNQYHTTKDGKVIHISKMDNQHLLNTAVLFCVTLRNSKQANKYIDEVKKRGLANEYFRLLDEKKTEVKNNKYGNELDVEVDDEYDDPYSEDYWF